MTPIATTVRQSAVSAAVQVLRAGILSGELSPGEQIRQDETAAQVGVSRLPLREAMRIMTSQGLLTHRPNQGYFVSKLSSGELEQILLLLEFLETGLLASISWPSTEQISELRQLNAALDRAAGRHDVGAQTHLNREFHALIYSMSPRKLYAGEVDRLSALAEPYLRLRFTDAEAARTLSEHEQLIDALEAQNRARCISIQDEHRAAFSAALRPLLQR